jgi:uncharacterized protein (DUF302 family)
MIDGLISVASAFSAEQTINRLEAEIRSRGLTIFARIDHAAGAADVGMTLPPTLVLIFGNARGGTPLMQAEQTIGIDLPLKALVHQDAAGKVWLSYNDPEWLAARHGLGAVATASVAAMTGLLRAITTKAATQA